MARAGEKTKTKRVALSADERTKLAAELGELACLEKKAIDAKKATAKPFRATIALQQENMKKAVAEFDEEILGHKQRMRAVLSDLERGTKEVLDQAGYGDA